MNKNPIYGPAVNTRKKECEDNYKAIYEIFDEMSKTKKYLSQMAICQKVGLAKNYFSRHKDLAEMYSQITGIPSNSRRKKQSTDDTSVVISTLHGKVKKQETELKKLRACNDELEHYKALCKEKDEKIKELEQQINDKIIETLNLEY